MEPSDPPVLPMPPPALTIYPGKRFAFMPDGEHLIVSGAEKAWMVSFATGQQAFEFDKPATPVRGVAVSDNGAVAALAAQRNRVILYDAQTGKKTHSLKVGNDDNLDGLEFAPRSHALLHLSWHGLTAIETERVPPVRLIRVSDVWPDNTMYCACAFSPSGDKFAAAWSKHGSNNVTIFEWPSGNEIRQLKCGKDSFDAKPNQVVFSPDGKSVIVKIVDGTVIVLPLGSPEPTTSDMAWIQRTDVAPDTDQVVLTSGGCLSFSPDGTLLAYGQRLLLSLWSWPSGQCLGKWRMSGKDKESQLTMILQIGFSLSGKEIVVSFWESPRGIFVYRVADLLNT